MTEIPKSKTCEWGNPRVREARFGHWNFEFGICFGFRASDFGFGVSKTASGFAAQRLHGPIFTLHATSRENFGTTTVSLASAQRVSSALRTVPV